MAIPDITYPGYLDLSIKVEETGSDVKYLTVLNGLYALGPQGQNIPLTNISISSTVNAQVITGVWSLDARLLPNGSPWFIKAKSSISNSDNTALGTDLQIETFSINIPGNSTSVFAKDYDLKTRSSLPVGWTQTNATTTFSSTEGMTITPSGSASWGARTIESEPFTYSDGNSVEIDFVASSSLMAVGLGKNKAQGGFGDFTDDDSLMWWGTDGTVMFGETENSAAASGEWVTGRNYRLNLKRIGSNTQITYSKDTGNGYQQFNQTSVPTPTALTSGTTRVLLDCAYSSSLVIKRVAIAV